MTELTKQTFGAKTLDYFSGKNGWVRVALIVGALLAYAAAFIEPFRPDQVSIVQLAVVPVIVAAWLLGFWGGILAALVSIPLNAALLDMLSTQPEGLIQVLSQPESLQGSVLLVVLGAVLGGLRDVADQMRREILARTEVEAARRESEERYRFVAESASDGIITIDADAVILFANRAAEKIFGQSITDMVGRPLTNYIPERHRADQGESLHRYLDTVITSNPDAALQLTGLRRGGREVTLEISFGEYVKSGEHVFTGIVRDVTERKRVEQILKRAKEEAERANQAKSDFLSRMSHELRTPLNAILGFAQLMQMDELDEDQSESVDQILTAGRHLLALVDEVLDIARIEAGRMSLSPEPVPVEEIVQEAWGLVRQRAAERGIEFTANPDACNVHVLADRQRLKQVLLNLMSNAVKYNKEGGSVRVDCSADTGMVRISVADTGEGIPESKMEHLFEPFERLGAEETGVEGTGIGLALSKGLVEAMDGLMGADSDEGEGSTFWLELPVAEVEDLESMIPGEVGTGVSIDQLVPDVDATILYIEDNPSNFKLVERVLGRRPGITLLTAMQGRLGLELAREHRPALVLLDLNLPDINGQEVLRRIRNDQDLRDTPVVVISADVTTGRIQKVLSQGAQAYLPKPLDVQEFLRVVDEILT
ncbi:MAG: ATP-binding protein [Gemmatimonadota bacterium]|jgi:PAS domain S-box-containing protein